jgi:TonB family protein
MATEKLTAPELRRHVILVDADVEPLRKVVAPLRDEYEFHLTISATDALALLHRHRIAAIVAAQKLFSSTGLELLAAARQRSPDTTRILVADSSDRKTLEESGADAGLFQVLQRPWTTNQLKESLHAAVRAAHMRTEDTGEVEHVVMETAEERPPPTEAAEVPITVLTTDAQLFEAISSAVQGRHEAFLATRLEDAAELATGGRCPVLITDQALARPALERITRHLHTYESALVTIAVGSREQGNALMGLLSTGQIHRFLLKPVTPGLARLAIDSACRQHLALKTHPRTDPLPLPHKHEAAPAPDHTVRRDPSQRQEPVKRREPPPPPPEQPTWAAPPARHPPPVEPPPEGPAFELVRDDRPASLPTAGFRPQRPIMQRELFGKRNLAILGAALVVGGALAWWFLRGPPVDPNIAVIQENLASATKAVAAGEIVAPPERSAVHFYNVVLQAEPQNATANKALDDIAERFIEQAETLIVEGRLDDAETALAGVKVARPQHRRLRFLDTQLRKEKQDRLVLRARESAGAGDLRSAQQLLEEAAKVSPGTPGDSAEVNAARVTLAERERSQTVTRMLETARQRVTQGRLVTPENDSAKFHLRSAQRLDPDNIAVQQGLRDLATRAATEAQRAIDRNQLENASTWIAEAASLGVPAAELTVLRTSLETATRENPKNELLALVLRRTQENRLLEPANDNAKHYLLRLRQMDAQFPGLPRAVDTLGARLVANAQLAISQRNFDLAANLLAEAEGIGYGGSDVVAAQTTLANARTPATSSPRIPQEVLPRRTRYVAPVYPRTALERGIEGWVDVGYTVNTQGLVSEVNVLAASRRGLFDNAALTAVRQWQYEARPQLDATFTQRMRMRVEFKLTD